MAKKSGHKGTIYQRKDGTWEAKISLGTDPNTGKRRRPSVYADSQEEIQQKLNKLLGQDYAGYDIDPKKIKFGTWIDKWLEDYSKPFVVQNTYEGYEASARLYIKPLLGEHQLNKLTTNDIQKAYNYLLKKGGKKGKGLSIKTIWNIHTVVRASLNQAQIEDLIIRNPIVGLRLPPKKKGENTYITAEQMAMYLGTICTHRLYAAFVLECVTGMRRGEILGLRWNCVNFKSGELKVKETWIKSVSGKTYFSKPKNESSKRTIMIPQEVVTELKKHKKAQAAERLTWGNDYQKHNLLFAKENGEPMRPDTFYETHIKLIGEAGLGHVRFHDLRHSVASALIKKGFTLKDIADLFGHSSIVVTGDVYGHLTKEQKHDTTQSLVSLIPVNEVVKH